MKLFALIGAISAALAVASGAFGAHFLETRVPEEMVETWKTGARYQMYHSLGLFVVAWYLERLPEATTAATAAGWSFVVGLVLFSGSLYLLVATGISKLGMITPLGGLAFIIGWLALAAAAL